MITNVDKVRKTCFVHVILYDVLQKVKGKKEKGFHSLIYGSKVSIHNSDS